MALVSVPVDAKGIHGMVVYLGSLLEESHNYQILCVF